ncbi:MAG: hypothetical protein HY716_17145 [Planctomycetes bacterium]|nr:hypothetical protein [Planctomycetota bacterium]
MEAVTFSNGDVIKVSNAGFINIKIDADRNGKLWKEKYRGEGLPTTFAVSGDGEILSRIVGFHDAATYLNLLKALPARVRALQDARAAAAKSPDDPAAQLALAKAWNDLDNDDETAPVLERVMGQLKGKDDETSRGQLAVAAADMAQLRYRQERWADVISAAGLYEKTDPENKKGRADELVPIVAVAILEGEQNADKALAALRDGMKKYPQSARMDQMMYFEGALVHQKGDHDKAVEIWKKTAEKFPDSPWGKAAKRAMEHQH